ALDEFAEDESIADDVVGRNLPGRPRRSCSRQGPHRAVPVRRRQRITADPARERDTGPVLEYVPDRDAVLAVLAELRPVPGYWVVKGKQSTLGEQVHQHGN